MESNVNESQPFPLLSPREQQVFALLADGYRLKEIGVRLFISGKTVSSHKARIMEKLNIATPVQWMALLRQFPTAGAA